MSCIDGVIPKMDLSPWKTASPHFVIPETLLEESVVRAKREAEDYIHQEESLQLTTGKCYVHFARGTVGMSQSVRPPCAVLVKESLV